MVKKESLGNFSLEGGIRYFPKNVREVAWAAVSETTGPVLSVLVLFGKS